MKKQYGRMITCLLIFTLFISLGLSGIDIQAAAKPVKTITLTAKSKKMTVGDTFSLKVKSVTPKSSSKAVTWKSSNTKIIKITSKGKVTAKKAGTATITAVSKTTKNVKAKCKIKVYNKIKSIKLNTSAKTLSIGETVALAPTISPNNTLKKVTWKSSNTKVASVSAKGVVTAKTQGSATITVVSKDSGKKQANCRITVTKGYTTTTLKSLKNTDNFLTSAIEHIFEGQINSSGNATGYHYDGIADSAGRIIPGTKTTPNALGVYEAKVEVKGIAKASNGGYSTFFPDSMSPQQVVDAINEAYANKQLIRSNIYIGSSQGGIDIEMYLTDDGKIISAFPIE